MQINGANKREYLSILLFIFKDIHRSFNQLTVTEKIGLPNSNPQLSVNHKHLLKLAKNGQSEYFPENSDESYKISELLGIVAPPSESEVMQMLQKIFKRLESQGIEKEKDLVDHIDEVVKVNPGMFGVSVDVNALVKKLLGR